jgi:predicted ribosomally synthesized peptide with SipW-like signal peptide
MRTRMSARARRRDLRLKALALLSGGVLFGLGSTATLASWTDREWVFGEATATAVFQLQQSVFDPGTDSVVAWESHTNDGEGDITQSDDARGNAVTFSVSPRSMTPGDQIYGGASLRMSDETYDDASLLMSHAYRINTTSTDPTTGQTVTEDSSLWDALRLRVIAVPASADTHVSACSARLFDDAAYRASVSAVWIQGAQGDAALATVAGGNATFPKIGSAPVRGAGADGAAPYLVHTDGEHAGEVETSLDATPRDRTDIPDAQDYCFEVTLPQDADQSLQEKTATPAWRFTATAIED